MKLYEIVGMVALICILVVILSFLFALPIMLLWNWLFTQSVTMTLFGVPKLTFFRAMGLAFLLNMLFNMNASKNSK